MPYVLPRIMIFATAWGVTCVLISAVQPAAGLTDFCFAGVSWAFAALVYISYMRKLRRERADVRIAKAVLPPGISARPPPAVVRESAPRDLDRAA